MAASAPRYHRYTFREYIAFEDASNVKHEFIDGEIYAMAGGTPEHAALSAAVIALLVSQLRDGRCRAFSSDLRVRVSATGLSTYPDATVVCGPLERDPEEKTVVTNPIVIVEVLSPSTEEFDRGEKLANYRQIASLRECVIVGQREQRIDVHRRSNDGAWTELSARSGESIALVSIACTIEVDALYRTAFGVSP